jgi:hypothetical protein
MQKCDSCGRDMREDDIVAVMESGDVLCGACHIDLVGEGLEDEIAYVRPLRDVHPDWRHG